MLHLYLGNKKYLMVTQSYFTAIWSCFKGTQNPTIDIQNLPTVTSKLTESYPKPSYSYTKATYRYLKAN